MGEGSLDSLDSGKQYNFNQTIYIYSCVRACECVCNIFVLLYVYTRAERRKGIRVMRVCTQYMFKKFCRFVKRENTVSTIIDRRAV